MNNLIMVFENNILTQILFNFNNMAPNTQNQTMEDVKVPLKSKQNIESTKYINVKNSDQTICTMCQYDLEDKNRVYKLKKCGHIFHRKCIKPWFKSYNHICPNCRIDVEK